MERGHRQVVDRAWILPTGGLYLDKSILIFGKGYGETLKVPVFSVLLLTENQYVLIDTGLNPNGLTHPDETWGERAKLLKPILSQEDHILHRLAEVGVESKDIKYVVHTHMHWDHTGGDQYFRDALFVAQKAEFRFAAYPDSHLSGSYMQNHYDLTAKYKLVEGDVELMPGINLLYTPGHTPGHQSVLVTMGNGERFIIAGDAIYTWENVESMKPPGNSWSGADSVSSLHKLMTLGSLLGAQIIPSHDPYEGFYERIKKLISAIN